MQDNSPPSTQPTTKRKSSPWTTPSKNALRASPTKVLMTINDCHGLRTFWTRSMTLQRIWWTTLHIKKGVCVREMITLKNLTRQKNIRKRLIKTNPITKTSLKWSHRYLSKETWLSWLLLSVPWQSQNSCPTRIFSDDLSWFLNYNILYWPSFKANLLIKIQIRIFTSITLQDFLRCFFFPKFMKVWAGLMK